MTTWVWNWVLNFQKTFSNQNKKSTKTATLQCVPLTISDQLISVSLKFRACYITSQWGEFRIKNDIMQLLYVFFTLSFDIFIVFHHKICVVIIFVSFFDEVLNSRNRILTNQKQELVIRNCQWNYMLWKCEIWKECVFAVL